MLPPAAKHRGAGLEQKKTSKIPSEMMVLSSMADFIVQLDVVNSNSNNWTEKSYFSSATPIQPLPHSPTIGVIVDVACCQILSGTALSSMADFMEAKSCFFVGERRFALSLASVIDVIVDVASCQTLGKFGTASFAARCRAFSVRWQFDKTSRSYKTEF